jgi:hypothetical protein
MALRAVDIQLVRSDERPVNPSRRAFAERIELALAREDVEVAIVSPLTGLVVWGGLPRVPLRSTLG